MLTTVTICREAGKVTANLVGPIVMNTRTLVAAQFALQDDRYCTSHVIGEKQSVESGAELAKAA
jgi:flagellar assembly factor FliW